jgi:hypothetical protein
MGIGGRIPPLLDAFARRICLILLGLIFCHAPIALLCKNPDWKPGQNEVKSTHERIHTAPGIRRKSL